VIERLVNALVNEKQALIAGLASGTCTDFPAYREMVGRIRGLEDALRIVEGLQEESGDESNAFRGFS
jgi:hypothetical protein